MSSWTLIAENDAETFVIGAPAGAEAPDWLEAGNVLCLKALGALLNFKLHCLAFVEGLIAVHHDRREVDENILSCLPLDEAVAL